jgi:transposase
MVQPFLTAGSLDLSARICVVAFAVAIPLLTALVMVNRQEVFRRRTSGPVGVGVHSAGYVRLERDTQFRHLRNGRIQYS